MWKLNKLSATLFLLFFSFLFSFSPLIQLKASAHSVGDSVFLSEEDKQKFVRGFLSRTNHEGKELQESSDIHYLIYNQRSNYSKENYVYVFAYTCKIRDTSKSPYVIKTLEDCGSYLTYDEKSGIYSVRARTAYDTRYPVRFSLKTKTFEGNSSIIDFQSTHQSGKTFERILSSSDDPDFYTVHLDTHNKINQFNIRPQTNFPEQQDNNGGFNLDFGAFAKGIVNGISDFFRDFIKAAEISFKAIVDFFLNFPKILADFVVSLFTIQPDYLDNKVSDFRTKLETRLGAIGRVFADTVQFFAIFSSNSNANLSCLHYSIVITEDSLPIKFDMCQVPRPLLILARVLLVTVIISVIFYRFVRFINILFGSKYLWTLDDKDKDEKKGGE